MRCGLGSAPTSGQANIVPATNRWALNAWWATWEFIIAGNTGVKNTATIVAR